MNIQEKSVVSIHYKLTDDKGEVIDQSQDQPLAYIHGVGALIPGLEKELLGKGAGDKLQVSVTPEEGYGPHMPQLIQKLPRDTFQGVDKIEVGMEFQASNENGETMVVRVEEVADDEITINGNHPLAGMTLNFDVEVVEVREASAEELEHGHVHGEGGHHHH
ncbi:FKBP-type peptidyl-prolyl cis-trans isomerase [Spirochaeta isovalerica]|uniref:Peptidyl-prolyl cis-trans isomerase n=1 Tax=Spirochaeta isovalerica TaxID=150 RepID=A0A841RER4_9SPIO|nr:peptidylprolyl isomerase [Spirochaeta isovalerica]MBB6482106.1 FKBP-type peptidyl-prolyl cis-trans isomerase SlyD [Spirochaeta isovalerica]